MVVYEPSNHDTSISSSISVIDEKVVIMYKVHFCTRRLRSTFLHSQVKEYIFVLPG